ncbi:hypothetical protein ACET3Z_012943 [Daucus carota]
MAQRPVVPQFGNWDTENNTPYTIYFAEARNAKNGGKMINPNDPMDYPGMFPNLAQESPSRARNVPEEPKGRTAVRPTIIRSQSRENGNNNVGRQSGTGSGQNRGGSGLGSGQPGRQNGESVHSIDRSPLHPQYQAKWNEKSSGSPAWENKYSNESSTATPGRSRMRPVSPGVQYPDKVAAVPIFGGWNENDPSSGENYTLAFNNVRHEKNSGSPMVSNMTAEQAYANKQKQNDRNKNKSMSRWFPCFGK